MKIYLKLLLILTLYCVDCDGILGFEKPKSWIPKYLAGDPETVVEKVGHSFNDHTAKWRNFLTGKSESWIPGNAIGKIGDVFNGATDSAVNQLIKGREAVTGAIRGKPDTVMEKIWSYGKDAVSSATSSFMIWVWDPVQNMFYPVPYSRLEKTVQDLKTSAMGKQKEDFFSYWVWNPAKNIYVNIPSADIYGSLKDISTSTPAKYADRFYTQWVRQPVGKFMKAGDRLYNNIPSFLTPEANRIETTQSFEWFLIGFCSGIIVVIVVEVFREISSQCSLDEDGVETFSEWRRSGRNRNQPEPWLAASTESEQELYQIQQR